MSKSIVSKNRLFIRVTRDSLPQVRDRYPFLYLEYGRLEVDGSSVKWVDCDGQVIPLPITTLLSILLGPGTSVTHEAIKVIASTNCGLSWVGEDSLVYYACGNNPTSDSRNMRAQISLSANPKKSLEVSRWLFSRRFPNEDLSDKSLKQMMGFEGNRVRSKYQEMADRYQVNWDGRRYKPGDFAGSNTTNRILTASNAALYGITCAVVHALGFSPHVGFIHSGSPLPFIYDVSDLYKEDVCVDLAFGLTKRMTGSYDRAVMADEFRRRVVDYNLIEKMVSDVTHILKFES